MLDNRITRERTLLPDVVAIGGTCDGYQPAEAKYKNTRQCLEVLQKHHYPVILSTKSDLVRRDLDVLSQIAQDTWCTVGVTITTIDEEIAGFLEPQAPSPRARLRVLEQIKNSCPTIQTGVNLIPIVPILCDNENNLDNMVSTAKEAGADYVLFGGGMTMMDNQASFFLEKLGAHSHQLVDKYLRLYEGSYVTEHVYQGKCQPKSSYLKQLHNTMFGLCQRHKINCRIKRFIPPKITASTTTL